MSIEDLNYALDRRVLAAQRRGEPYPRFDRAAMTLTFGIPADSIDVDLAAAAGVDAAALEQLAENEAMVEITLPAAWEVCDTCEGHGTHVNPSIDASGISQETFDDDPDFHDAYRSGAFDVCCSGCGGERVVPGVSTRSLSTQQRTLLEAIQGIEERREQERRNDARMRALGM